MKKEYISVFLGRFSPLHRGHQKVIDRMISENGVAKCLIIIGSSTSHNSRTPYTFLQRKKMIKKIYPDIKIIGFPDTKPESNNFQMSSLNIWVTRLKKLEKSMHANFVFYCGGLEDVSYLKKYFKIILSTQRNTNKISATLIRRRIRYNNINKLSKIVDKRVLKLAIKWYKHI